MNARANLITALLTLSLIGPTVAGAQIPRDPNPTVAKQPKVHLHTGAATYALIGASAGGNWAAYVHGGASKEVAKAIANRANYVAASASASNVASAIVAPGTCAAAVADNKRISIRVTTALSAQIEPTDKSIPPLMMTKVSPSDISAMKLKFFEMLSRLRGVINTGARIEMTTIRAAKAMAT